VSLPPTFQVANISSVIAVAAAPRAAFFGAPNSTATAIPRRSSVKTAPASVTLTLSALQRSAPHAHLKAQPHHGKEEESKTIYKQRAATAETVNADAKAHRGLDSMAVRGLTKVTGSVSLFALT